MINLVLNLNLNVEQKATKAKILEERENGNRNLRIHRFMFQIYSTALWEAS